ncbi:MAG: DUF2341 domain-containing protein [Burkholderiales bacterium]
MLTTRVARFALVLLCSAASRSALAQVTVIPATGGGAISADSAGGTPWTTLSGPELDETSNGSNGAFGNGTIVLNAPTGFEFNTGATVTVTIGLAPGSAGGGNQINLGGGRGNPVSATVAATTISVTVTQGSGGSRWNSLIWSNIQLRPTAASRCPLAASGTITETGTSSFTQTSANLGTLAEVAGATSMYAVLPGQTFTACSGIGGTPASQTAGVAFNLASLVVADQWGNVNTGYSGAKTISYSGPSGSSSYTTSVAFTSGISTTTLATTLNSAQTTTITATDGTVPGAASSSFTVGCNTTPPWYNAAWQYRKAITIDHTKVGGTLANFPVLVSVTDANLQAGAQASGNDILFTDSSGTAKLAHEIELYTSATGQLIAWVSVPSVSASTDTVIYMYYGNPSAGAQQNPSAVWDADFKGVWHLKETGSTAAGGYKDSTSNGNNATGGDGIASYVPAQAAGQIGYGQQFSGGQLIYGATSSMPAVNGNQTMSFWYKVTTNPTTRANFLTLRIATGGMANQGVFVGPVSGSCGAYAASIGATQWGGTCTIDANAPAAGAWHYFVFTHSGTTNTLYMDGVQVATSTVALQGGTIGEFIWGSYTTTPAEPLTGLMDETRVSDLARSAAWILTAYNSQGSPSTFLSLGAQQTYTSSCYTYYAITYPGGSTGVTCDVSQVTITAYNASNVASAPPSATTLGISTSTGAGVWTNLVGGAGTLSGNGANNGLASYVWAGGENSITLNLRQNTPATINVNLLDSNGKIENSGTSDPSITFANAAFRITDAAGTALATLGTQISGKPSNVGFGAQTRYLQAIRTDTNTGSCVALIQSQTVSVGLAGARINPSGGASQLSVLNSGGAMQAIGTGAGAPGAYTNVSLAFDAQSKAPLVLSYPDAGSVALYASYALPSPPAGTAVTGSSNTFVTRPFGLRIGAVPSGLSGASSTVFKAAGQSFPVSVTAVQWQAGNDVNADGVPDSDAQIATNPATPNFGLETSPATVALSSTLNQPAGGAAGTLTAGSWSAFASGTSSANASWSEVGLINLFAASSNYLGSGQSVTDSSAGLTGVGRFIPDHFALSGGVLTNRAATACAPASAFSYLGEGMRLQFTLTAQSTANATTQNYNTAAGFAKLPTAPSSASPASSLGFGAVNGATDLSSRLDLGNSASLTWSAGAASVDYTLAVDRASPDNPDGPFAATTVGIAPQDGDGVGLASAAFNMTVGGVNNHQQVGASTQLLFGRLVLRNALGAKTAPLPVPITAQSWTGSAFVTNALDSCSKIPQNAIVLGGYEGALAPGGGNCKTFVQQNPVVFSAGVGTLTLAAPTGGASGSVLLTPNLYPAATGNYCAGAAGGETAASGTGLGYLLGRWNDLLNPDGIASTMYDDNPSARAAFGLYGSQPKNLIYQREYY